MELKQKIIQLIRESGIACFATITEDNKPWVRYVSVDVDDDMTIRFSTFNDARKVIQIKNNPEVHLTCGIVDPQQWNDYLQIQGIAEVTQDQKEREAFWNEEIAQFFKSPADPNYSIVIVKPYRVEYWSITTMQSEVWER